MLGDFGGFFRLLGLLLHLLDIPLIGLLYPSRTLVSCPDAHFADCSYPVGGFDFGVDCGAPVGPGTSILLPSFGRSQETNLDHTDRVGIHPFSGPRRIVPPVITHLPLVADLRGARSVLMVLLVD